MAAFYNGLLMSWLQAPYSAMGLDHGAGHSLLLLCGAKTPRDKKSKEFKAIGHYLCNVSIGLL